MGSAHWEQKKRKWSRFFCRFVFFVDIYGNEFISLGGYKKTQTYRTVHAFRSTVQNLPLRTRCAQGGPNNSNYCHGCRSSNRGRVLRLYLTCRLPEHLCVDGMHDENIPDEDIVAAVAVGASVIEYWYTGSGIAVVWSG